MHIIEDTRQKSTKHAQKHSDWKESGDVVLRCKLPYGDYAKPPEIAVDTKAGLQEIAINLCGSAAERKRVAAEEELAQKLNGKLIFLVEQEGVESMRDLIGMQIVLGSGKVIKGEQLMIAMENHTHKYGSEFTFCAPSEAGRKVKALLEGGS